MLARRRSGFTLIELLVVIAIIAILAAILFPVFARARETARKSTCGSNLHEAGIALQTYWGDFDATLPSSATSGNPVGFITGTGVGAPLPSIANKVSWAQMVYDYVKNKDVLFCPSDSSKDTYTSLSYWWKTAANEAWLGNGVMACKKESDFGFTADQIILYEHSGFHSSDSVLKNGVQINVCFLDSHVRTVSLPATAAAPAATATIFPNANTTDLYVAGEPMYYNYNFTADAGPAIGKYVDARNYGDKL